MSIPFYNNIDLHNNKIENLLLPTTEYDASNKLYVDTQIENLRTNINDNILLSEENLTEYIDNQIDNLNTNIPTTVSQIVVDNIIDNILSDDNTKSLSANMGKYLSSLIDDNKTDIVDIYTKLDTYNSNVYSYTPTYIGKYLDNDLYRVVYDYTFDAETQPQQNWSIDMSAIFSETPNIIVTDIRGNYILNDKRGFIRISPMNVGTEGIYVQNFDETTYTLNLFLAQNYISMLSGQTIQIIMEYYVDTTVEDTTEEIIE